MVSKFRLALLGFGPGHKFYLEGFSQKIKPQKMILMSTYIQIWLPDGNFFIYLFYLMIIFIFKFLWTLNNYSASYIILTGYRVPDNCFFILKKLL